MFCDARARGHINSAATADKNLPVSPLTTTRDNKQAHAIAVRWLPSFGTEDSGPWRVARSKRRSNNGSITSGGSDFRPSGV